MPDGPRLRPPAGGGRAQSLEVLVGLLGALSVLTLLVTVWCELTGRPAVAPALVLLALVLLTWLAWRTWRRYRP